MKKTGIAIVACLLALVALACPACAQQQAETSKAAEASEATAAPESQEPETFTEGVDTACEVSYSDYAGAHGSLFLKQGDSVAVISPSSLPTREQVDAVVAGLEKWGYVPVEGEYVYCEERTLDDCLADLEWALEDPDIKAIFCVRGGYGASEVADELALDLIKRANKLIIGYSDITVYHSAWTVAGVPSVHASMSAAFGDFPEACFNAEQNIIEGQIPSYTCAGSSFDKTGEAEGVLIGGNLSTFTSVIGTAYDSTKIDQPYILFLEDEGENMQHLHRYLTVLKHAGVLDKAAGIVFGEWADIPADLEDYPGDSRGGTFTSMGDMITRQFLQDLDVPVAFGLPAGHGDTNYPLLMGEVAHLSVSGDSFSLSWAD